jgi:molybdopterin molybdotransferase
MITYEDALRKVLEKAEALGTIELPLNQLLGHTLAEPLVADFDLPSFDNSAVDGFGVLVQDLVKATPESPAVLELDGELRAGKAGDVERYSLPSNTAIKILTGAMVPPSVEAVVMREFCQEKDGRLIVHQAVCQGENIRRKGGEVRAGTTILGRGTKIDPPVLALIATVGSDRAVAYRKPRVSIVVTGDELVPPGSKLEAGQIFDSNAFALEAALRCLGIDQCKILHVRDAVDETSDALKEALAFGDIVISSGGVSVGDHDYVKPTLEALNVETVFWRIAIKPGKPVYFGTLDTGEKTKKLVFGLPGNPVSVLVTFHQFVKPAIKKIMGESAVKSPIFYAKLKSAIRKRAGRLDFMRGILEAKESAELYATAVKGQDSHMLTGLAAADCLLHFAADAEELSADDTIPFQFIDWFN